jgi:hypothetical protein
MQKIITERPSLGTDVMILKIFSPKNSAKILAFFYSKQSLIMQKLDHNIGFGEKRQFLRRNLPKIAGNCDHNIDPRSGCART